MSESGFIGLGGIQHDKHGELILGALFFDKGISIKLDLWV